MKVFHPTGKAHTLMVAPGAMIKGEIPSDWSEPDGRPKRFDIVFDHDGIASVDDKMGKFLVENGFAHKSPLKRVYNRLIA